jgi:glycosyltransferase involved in cell wall biosynthesis
MALRAAGHTAEIVTLPFRFLPETEVERAMQAWEREDFEHLNRYEPERVICLMFPSYGLRHPRKTAWLLHQHRSAYEQGSAIVAEGSVTSRVRTFDAQHLAQCRRFTISKRVSERLLANNQLDSEPLYHPPFAADRLYCGESLPYIFFPSRFESAKRQELLVRAMALVKSPVAAVLAGQGGQQGRMKELVVKLDLQSRVRLVGPASWDEMRALYARSLAVFFGPHDEDYGYVTIEAMLSRKPVITCTDSGGPLEFVVDGVTGRVVAPEPAAVADAIDTLWSDRVRTRQMGVAGYERYRKLDITWDHVVQRLLGTK